jgi:hypothetical protein
VVHCLSLRSGTVHRRCPRGAHQVPSRGGRSRQAAGTWSRFARLGPRVLEGALHLVAAPHNRRPSWRTRRVRWPRSASYLCAAAGCRRPISIVSFRPRRDRRRRPSPATSAHPRVGLDPPLANPDAGNLTGLTGAIPTRQTRRPLSMPSRAIAAPSLHTNNSHGADPASAPRRTLVGMVERLRTPRAQHSLRRIGALRTGARGRRRLGQPSTDHRRHSPSRAERVSRLGIGPVLSSGDGRSRALRLPRECVCRARCGPSDSRAHSARLVARALAHGVNRPRRATAAA